MVVPIPSHALAVVLGLLYCTHAFFLTAMMEPRYSWRINLALWAAAVGVSAAGGVVIRRYFSMELSVALAYILAALMFTSIFWLLSVDPAPKKVFLIALMMCIFTMCYVVSTFIGAALGSRMVNAVSCLLLYLGSILGYLYGLKNPIREVSFRRDSQWWDLTAILLCFGLIIAVDTIFVHQAWYFSPSDVALTMAQILLLVLVMASVFRTIRYMERTAEYEKEKERSRFYAHQLAEMRKSEENTRRIQHDLRHHSLTVAEYARSGNLEGLLRYLDACEQAGERLTYRRYCQDDTANSIISAYVPRAELAGIRMTVQAPVSRELPVVPTDLVAILANVLENAIHGCQTSGREDTAVDLRINEKSGKLVISCENTCADHILFDRGGLPRNPKRKGLGVASILSAAKNYDGSVEFSAKDNLFSCLVILNLE